MLTSSATCGVRLRSDFKGYTMAWYRSTLIAVSVIQVAWALTYVESGNNKQE